jgi:hypothetical protein
VEKVGDVIWAVLWAEGLLERPSFGLHGPPYKGAEGPNGPGAVNQGEETSVALTPVNTDSDEFGVLSRPIESRADRHASDSSKDPNILSRAGADNHARIRNRLDLNSRGPLCAFKAAGRDIQIHADNCESNSRSNVSGLIRHLPAHARGVND